MGIKENLNSNAPGESMPIDVDQANTFLKLTRDYFYESLLTKDLNFKITWLGGRFKDITGYTWQEIEKLPGNFMQIIEPSDKERILTEHHNNHEEVVTYTYRILHKEGGIRWIEDMVQRHFDEDGNIVKITGAVKDITTEKEAKFALENSIKRLDLALQCANEGLWDWYLPTGQTTFNDVYYTMLGYAPGDHIKSFEDFLAWIHPDDVERIKKLNKDFALRNTSMYKAEFRMRNRKGGWQWILSRGNIAERSSDGSPIRLLGTHTDITQEKFARDQAKDAELKYQNLFNSMHDGFAIFTIIFDNSNVATDFQYLLVNPAFERLANIPAHKCIGKTLREVLPDRADIWLEVCGRVVKSKKTENFEYQSKISNNFFDVSVFLSAPGQISAIYRDKTEQFKLNNQLEAERKKISNLMENVPGMVYRCKADEHWTMEFVSEGCRELTGYEVADFIDNKTINFNQIICEPYRKKLQLADEFQENNQHFVEEYEIRTATGEVKYVWEKGMGIYSKMGELLYLEGFITDITERKKIEDSLKKSEARNKALLSAIPDLMFLFDKNGRYIDYNNTSNIKTLVAPEKFLGKTISDVLSDELANLTYQKIDALLKTGEMQVYTYSVNNGLKIANFESRLVHCGQDEILAIIRDVTDRQQYEQALQLSEQRWQFALEGARDGVWDWNLEDNSAFFSIRLKTILGYVKDELSKKMDEITSRIHPDDLPIRNKIMNEHLEGISSFYQCEYRINNIKGQYIWVLDRGMVLERSKDNLPLRMIGTLSDISERKENELEIRRINEELKQFTYTVSHDLKSPLLTIQSFAGFLEKDIKANKIDKVESSLGFINFAIDKMNQLLNDLLELSRIGRKTGPHEQINLSDLLDQVISLLAGRIQQKKVEIIRPKKDLILTGDIIRLTQAFQNLLENAIKFMGNQENPCIEIGIKKIDQDNHIYIRDNGIGVDAKFIPKIFDLFQKLNTKEEGTGIGLTLVKRIVELHGGKIWVESEGLGKGTTFWLRLAGTQKV